jgi:hypothetical protein
MIECLPSKPEALSSNPSTVKKKKNQVLGKGLFMQDLHMYKMVHILVVSNNDQIGLLLWTFN